MSLFLGFANTHKAIASLGEQVENEQGAPGLMHKLAQSSANISVDNDQSTSEKWYLVDESDGGLRLQTRSSRYTKKISVGQLVSINNTGKGGPYRLELGFVTRINRNHETEIEISVVKICKRPAAVLVQDNNRQGKDAAMVAFLVSNEDLTKQLVLPNSWQVTQGQKLVLIYQKFEHTIILTNPTLQQRDFTVYNIAVQA